MVYEPFIDGASPAISGTFQLDYTQNAYLENASSSGAKTGKALIGAPGTAQLFDLGDGPVRGEISLEGYTFTVSAGNVWVKDPLDIITLLGTVSNDGLPVKMVSSTTQVFLRSAGNGYCITGGAVSLVVGPWTYLADIEKLGDYFVALDDDLTYPVGGQFFISSPNDCQTAAWDPLDFATVPSSNNKLRALSVIDNILYVIGSVSTQPFYDSGNADFPIVPNLSGTMMIGTTARDSVSKVAKDPGQAGSTIFMLTENADGHAQVAKIVGFTATIVSTPPLDRIFQGYSKISDVIGWAFQMGGHVFYHVTFPDAQASWRYDSSTNRWAASTWSNQSTGLQEAHRGVNHCFNNGRHLVGDRQYGIIWLLSQDIYSDGSPTDPSAVVENFDQRIVLLPSDGTERMFVDRIELLCETGVGDGSGSGPGDDPVAELYMSYDGGRTWEDPQPARLGRQGEYDIRVEWPRQGSGKQIAVKIEVDAPVKRVWSGLIVEMHKGNNK